jgi:hypothetical protein
MYNIYDHDTYSDKFFFGSRNYKDKFQIKTINSYPIEYVNTLRRGIGIEFLRITLDILKL